MDENVIKKELYFFLLESGIPYEGWVDWGDGIVAYALREVEVVSVPINKYGDHYLKMMTIPVCVIDKARIDTRQMDIERNISSHTSADSDEINSSKDVTPWDVGVEWLTGTGPRDRVFHGGDYFTELLKQHDHIKDTKNILINKFRKGDFSDGHNNYGLSGIQGVGKYVKDYSTLTTIGLTGNLAVTYLGSYRLLYNVLSINNNLVVVQFTVTNSSTIASGTRPPIIGYQDWWKNSVGQFLNNAFSSGPMSKTTQTFIWTETLYW